MIARKISTAAILIAAAASAGAAQARTVSIAYHPYELSSPAGQDAVLARIERAAARACAIGSTLAEYAARRSCRDELVGQMVARSGSVTLAALRAGEVRIASR
jgi:UrcA family protein